MEIRMLWFMLSAQCRLLRSKSEEGSVVEKVILTAIFAALAVAVGAIIVTKITAKANTINLH